MSGPPTLLAALRRGLGTALRAWRWLLVAVLVHLLLAAPVAAWAGWRMAKASENRPDAPSAGEVPDGAFLADLGRADPTLEGDLALVIGLLVVAAALARAVLDAGIAGTAADPSGGAALADLGARAGALAGRFLRLLLLAAAAAAVIRLLVDGLLAKPWEEWVEETIPADRTAWFALRSRELLAVALLFLLGRVSDAARGAMASSGKRSAARAWLGGFRFLARRPGACLGAGLLPAVAQGLLVLALGTLVAAAEGPSLFSVVAAALLFQVLLLLREICHATGLAAMTVLVAGEAPAEAP